MQSLKWIWMILWGGASLLFISILFLFLFKENGMLSYGIALFNSTLLLLSIFLNYILRNSIRNVRIVGWISSGMIILLALIQIVDNTLIKSLWNYSLMAMTTLSGTVLYRTLRSNLAGKIISITLTVFIIIVLIIGNTSSIFDRIALSLFILGALSSLYLIFKTEINE